MRQRPLLLFNLLNDYMKSVATNEFPEIEWEIGEMISKDIDERMEVFVATGEDAAGNKYEAEAYYYGNELEEIKHIEKV